MSDPRARQIAEHWLESQRAVYADALVKKGECRNCGAAAGVRHAPNFGCGIVADLLAALTAAEARPQPQCGTHGDPLICLACEAEESQRSEWHTPVHRVTPPRLRGEPEREPQPVHRCTGCGHRWTDLHGAELCGDCWRKAQPVVHAPASVAAEARPHDAQHESAPEGYKCSDCTIDREPCPTCYAAWWKQRHPNHAVLAAAEVPASLPLARLVAVGHAMAAGTDKHLAYRWQQAHEALSDAEVAAAEARGPHPQQNWQPIATAPKDGVPFIAANRMDAFRAFYDTEQEVWTAEDSGQWFGQLKYPPTHWMPLPDPPVEARGPVPARQEPSREVDGLRARNASLEMEIARVRTQRDDALGELTETRTTIAAVRGELAEVEQRGVRQG